MQIFESFNHLTPNHQRRFERKLACTELKQVSEAGTEQVHGHIERIIVFAVPINLAEALGVYSRPIQQQSYVSLVEHQRKLGIDLLRFDGHQLKRMHIDCQIDLPKGASSNHSHDFVCLVNNFVFLQHFKVLILLYNTCNYKKANRKLPDKILASRLYPTISHFNYGNCGEYRGELRKLKII